MTNQFTIPLEVADDITLKNLQDHYRMTKESLDKWYDGKEWLHRDDVDHCVVLMGHLKAIIGYFGGSIEQT